MERLKAVASMVGLFLMSGAEAMAQGGDSNAACAACGGSVLFAIIAVVVINIAILIWVVKDAKARGMGSPLGWLILVLIFGPLGLIIYFFSRPKGSLVPCENCGNKKLEAMKPCPHCGQ